MKKEINKISIIDINWVRLKDNIKIFQLPRQDELIQLNNKYFKVVKIIHTFDINQIIFIVVEENNIN